MFSDDDDDLFFNILTPADVDSQSDHNSLIFSSPQPSTIDREFLHPVLDIENDERPINPPFVVGNKDAANLSPKSSIVDDFELHFKKFSKKLNQKNSKFTGSKKSFRSEKFVTYDGPTSADWKRSKNVLSHSKINTLSFPHQKCSKNCRETFDLEFDIQNDDESLKFSEIFFEAINPPSLKVPSSAKITTSSYASNFDNFKEFSKSFDHKDSGCASLFERTLRSEKVVPYYEEEPSSEKVIEEFEETLKNVDLKTEARDFLKEPIGNKTYWPNFEYFGAKLMQGNVIPDLKNLIRDCLQKELDKNERIEILADKKGSPDISKNTEGKQEMAEINNRVSPDMFSDEEDSDDDICLKSEQSENLFEELEALSIKKETIPLTTIDCTRKIPNETRNSIFIEKIERLKLKFLGNVANKEPVEFLIRNTKCKLNLAFTDEVLTLKPTESSSLKRISQSNRRTESRFEIIMFLLSEIYELLLSGTTCTIRELYYKDPEFVQNQTNISLALNDVCCLLEAKPWELGILSTSKGLIAGSIFLILSSDEIVDCTLNSGGILLPHDTTGIKFLSSTAKYVLVVEKDTVFKKLLSQDIFNVLGPDIILITGKGFPDINTRVILNKISNQLKIPIYGLFDADPFGIDIYFVYKYGSAAMSFNADVLACPKLQWIGIHPSEIDLLGIPSMNLTKEDRKRNQSLLERPYLSEEIRRELVVLQKGNKKAEIEGLSNFSPNYLLAEYIPNKIKRKVSM